MAVKTAHKEARAQPRRRLDVEARRAQIVAAAQAVFHEQAYDQVNVADIAERAGVSRALVFHYFNSKRGLYVAMLEQLTEELMELVAAPRPGPPAERLVHGFHSYFHYVDQHAEAFNALMRAGLGADPEVATLISDTRERILTRLLQSAGAGSLEEPRTRATLQGLLGFCEGLAFDFLKHRDLPIVELTRLATASAAGAFPSEAAAFKHALATLDE